ncbi:MAG: response regulator [Thermodesulfobacteriota bacterium]|nr:response regulator [Thermodesulfobacteriota bacterium]
MKILVVDDDPITCELLISMLKAMNQQGTAVNEASKALELIEQENIGIVIVDWLMPGMDGMELCRQIRKKNTTSYIYLIMLSAKSEKKDLLKGFAAGVDAYLPKPPEQDTLDARIRAGTRIVNLERQLTAEKQIVTQYAQKMEVLARQRAKQLLHADRMATLGTLSAGIAHEINNPATFISGNVQILEKFWHIQAQWLESGALQDADADQLATILKETPDVIQAIKNGISRISKIINGLKTYAHADTHLSVDYDIHQTINDALMLCHNALKYKIDIEKAFAPDIPLLCGNPQQMEQVFVNIINNAADAMEDKPTGRIRIQTALTDYYVRIVISDTGPGFNPDALQKIWDPFYTTKPVGKGTGLGMSIVKGIIESHHGTIQASNCDDTGGVFTIHLPRNRNACPQPIGLEA